MQIFENLFTTEFLGSMKQVDDVAELYRKGFKTQNAIVAVCAQNELVRRGYLDIVIKTLLECVENGLMQYGTEFTHLVAMSLESIGDLDPMLSKIGKHIYDNADKAGAVTTEEIRQLVRTPGVFDIKQFDPKMVKGMTRRTRRIAKEM